MNVQYIPSAAERTARENLDTFVQSGRALGVALGCVEFDDHVWEDIKSKRGHEAKQNIHFTRSGSNKGDGSESAMREPFASFIKSMIRHDEHAKPKRTNVHKQTLTAGRFLHERLSDRAWDPTMLQVTDFDAAATQARKIYADQTAYNIGKALAKIARVVSRRQLTVAPIEWRNPIKRSPDVGGTRHTSLQEEAQQARRRKMASDDALRALAVLANTVSDDRDLLRQRAVELMMCTGFRIGEVLSLPADCWVEEPAVENGEAKYDQTGTRVKNYGLRYVSEKRNRSEIKWLAPVMVDIARRAVGDILRLTETARNNAHILLTAGAPLPDAYAKQPETTELGASDVRSIFGVKNARQFLNTHNVSYRKNGSGYVAVQLSSITFLIRSLSSDNLANQVSAGKQGGTCLFIVERNFFHGGNRQPIRGTAVRVTQEQIALYISGREGVKSAFERYQLQGRDGEPLKVNSHAFRHWLDTILEEGGVPEMMIAEYFGRAEVSQNTVYDHVTPVERARRVREMSERGQLHGPAVDLSDSVQPYSREDFHKAFFATAHVTDVGLCFHDWAMSPCPRHGDCLNCPEAGLEKGNEAQRDRIQTYHDDNKWLLERARAEAEDDTYGAANWLRHQALTVRNAQKALAIHDDDNLEDGTIIVFEPERASDDGTE